MFFVGIDWAYKHLDYCITTKLGDVILRNRVEYYIHLAHRLGYLADADFQKLNALQDETARVLTGFIRFKQQEAEANS